MDYAEYIRERTEKNNFARLIDLKLDEVTEHGAIASMPITTKHLNPFGAVHGGCLYTIADVVAGSAANAHGKPAVTLDSDFHFLRAGIGTTKLVGMSKELKCGKKVLVYYVEIADQNEKVLAEGTFTYMVIDKKQDELGK